MKRNFKFHNRRCATNYIFTKYYDWIIWRAWTWQNWPRKKMTELDGTLEEMPGEIFIGILISEKLSWIKRLLWQKKSNLSKFSTVGVRYQGRGLCFTWNTWKFLKNNWLLVTVVTSMDYDKLLKQVLTNKFTILITMSFMYSIKYNSVLMKENYIRGI